MTSAQKSTLKSVSIILGIILLAFGGIFWSHQLQSVPEGTYDVFAQCLAEKKFTMYGAEWCPYCKEEREAFGSAFDTYVPYVECPENVALCTEKKIEGYPTWIDGNGVSYGGKQGLEKLSQLSGCPLP